MYILCSFHFTKKFLCITADTTRVDFNDLDFTFWINHESTTICQTFSFNQYLEVFRQSPGWITNQWILDFTNHVRGIMPSFMGEMGIGRHAIDFHAHFLEFSILISKIAQFSWTNKTEICTIEKHHRPFTFQISFRNFDELTIVVSSCIEWFDFSID